MSYSLCQLKYRLSSHKNHENREQGTVSEFGCWWRTSHVLAWRYWDGEAAAPALQCAI